MWYDFGMASRTDGLLAGLPLPLPEETAEVLLELGFLVSAVDGELVPEELIAFRRLATRLLPDEDPPDLLERFDVAAKTVGVKPRLRQLAEVVPPELREGAFKLAVGLSLIDDDESDELVGFLGAALGLVERALLLADEARTAVGS